MKLEKTKNIAEVLMWIGLVPQWIFMIMTFVSFLMYVLIAVEEKSVKDTWWQLLVTGAWSTFLLLLFTGVIRF